MPQSVIYVLISIFLANATSISNDNNSSTNAEDILDTYSHDDASVDLVPVLEPTGM